MKLYTPIKGIDNTLKQLEGIKNFTIEEITTMVKILDYAKGLNVQREPETCYAEINVPIDMWEKIGILKGWRE